MHVFLFVYALELFFRSFPVEEDLDSCHLVYLPVTPFADTVEVGVPLCVEGEIGGEEAGESVVELEFEIEVGLECPSLHPTKAGEVVVGIALAV